MRTRLLLLTLALPLAGCGRHEEPQAPPLPVTLVRVAGGESGGGTRYSASLTPDVQVSVLVDGHRVGDRAAGERVVVALGPDRSLLGILPDATFVRRYRQSFGGA